ncbi:MAG: carbon starvation CstA family protein [Planctomycetota bacterium]|nr:carbon starvation CstA family protein [Planctomycetota bacterium]
MSLLAMMLAVAVCLVAGYFLYGSFIARQYRIDDTRATPAALQNDGVDFIPTNPFYLLSQHFSAIAAAGPIAGPILACMSFGWLPCLLWIVVGVVFIGAVHDFSALVASVRHGAHSIAEIARRNLGRRAALALVAFIWIALVYVIIAFTQITAGTFVGVSEEIAGIDAPFNKGGAVAMASTLYLLLALVLGVVQRVLRPPLWLVTAIFVPASLVCVWAGTRLDDVLVFGARTWFVVILAYCFVSSMLPMWLLQQPRGYLGGFILYLAIAVGLFGVLLGGFDVKQPMLTERALETLNPLSALALLDREQAGGSMTGYILPFLFVTIACGACSGFHGLICGGTTSKQIARESHCHPVGYGAMLLEGLVAVIALSTVMVLTPAEAKGLTPARVYGDGLAAYLTLALGKEAFVFCATFGAMAFSTFVFDTLDVSTRLGRYLLSELVFSRGENRVDEAPAQPEPGASPQDRRARQLVGVLAAGATAGVPLVMLLTADPSAYVLFWTLFGTSNQLLAALTLLGVAVWLKRSGRRAWYVLGPAAFMSVITLWALLIQLAVGLRDLAAGSARTSAGDLNPTVLNGLAAGALLVLAAIVYWSAIATLLRARRTDAPSDARREVLSDPSRRDEA